MALTERFYPEYMLIGECDVYTIVTFVISCSITLVVILARTHLIKTFYLNVIPG